MRVSYVFVLFFLFYTVSQAQKAVWQQFDGPNKKDIERVYEGENGHVYAFNGGDIFESIDNAETWNRLDLPQLTHAAEGPFTDGYWHFAQYSGYNLYRTNPDMDEWGLITPNFSNPDERLRHTTLVDSVLLVQSTRGIYCSKNFGESWKQKLSFSETNVTWSGSPKIVVTDSYVIAASDSEVFRSKDKGNTWEKVWDAPDDIEAFYVSDNLQCALLRNDDLLYVSSDGFNTQTLSDADVNSKYSTQFLFTKDTAFLFRPRDDYDSIPYLFYSVDFGVQWSQKNIDDSSFLLQYPIQILPASDQYYIRDDAGMHLYEHKASMNKIRTLEGLGNSAVSIIQTTESYIWVLQDRVAYKKLKTGGDWEKVEFALLEENERVYDIVKVRDYLIFKIADFMLWTIDEGSHFQKIEPPNSSLTSGNWWFTKESVWFQNWDSDLYRLNRNFQFWEEVEIDEPFMDFANRSLSGSYGLILAYTDEGDYYSADDALTWEPMPEMECSIFTFDPNAGPYVLGRIENQVIWWCYNVIGRAYYRTVIPDFGDWDYRFQDYENGVLFGSRPTDDILILEGAGMLWVYRYEDKHLYYSNNPYGHYYRLEEPLPAHTISVLHQTENELYVGSRFRGIYSYSSLKIQEEGKKELDITLYPNPTSNTLFLQSNALVGTGLFDVKIFNSLGQLMYTKKKTPASLVELDVQMLSSGLYFLKINSERGNYEARFIKR